ncbi:MAG TPA: alternative ribosome rescue aminoacyl-tRNA hydrolase ArfB [Tepidisphaeraceae bacterium]|nr:alternative ribosome rescue aminoacyl-tRNA hydrolase ArfB [Tepidisphaeraceae bacterium]
MTDPAAPFPDPPRQPPEPTGTRLDLGHGAWTTEQALRIQYARSSGPGGQNVNKVNTKAQLWLPLTAIVGLSPNAFDRLRKLAGSRLTAAGELSIVAETERTQEGNRTAVLDRLRALIAQAAPEPRKRKKTKPSRRARERRLQSKKRRSDVKARRRGVD